MSHLNSASGQGIDAESTRLRLLEHYDVLTMPPDPSLTRIAQIAANLSASTVGLVSIVASETLVFKAGAEELPVQSLPRKSSLCDAAIRVGGRFEVCDVKDDSRFKVYSDPTHPLCGQVVSYAGVPLTCAEGGVLGMLCVIGNSVRSLNEDHWRALEALADSAMSIIEAQARASQSVRSLGALIESLDSEFLLLDAETLTVNYANSGVARRLGQHAGTLSGSPLHRVFPPEMCRILRAASALLALQPESFVPIECEMVHAELGRVQIRGSVQRRGWRDSHALVVMTNDCTELSNARDARAKAEAASQAKSEFLTRVSHEFRTPLNAVLGFSQLMLGDRDLPLPAAHAAHLKQVLKAGWLLLNLISDVLDIARIESGNLAIRSEAVEIHALADEMLELMGSEATQAEVTLIPRYRDHAPVSALADSLRLRQVLLNLLSNAVKYNRCGGTVTVDVIECQGRIRLSVIDTGIGLTHEQLSQLFQPFNRLGREASGVLGTGIGLALSRQLVELMDGQIEVDSTPDQGTRMTVCLPSVDFVPAPARVVPLRPDRALILTGCVLCIEDDPVNMLLVRHLFARWPEVRLFEASDGCTGLALARRERPDLILLDMNLPDQSGIEVLQSLSRDEATRNLKVIMLSASATSEDMAMARKYGAQSYLTKPIVLRDFDAEVMRWLGSLRSTVTAG